MTMARSTSFRDTMPTSRPVVDDRQPRHVVLVHERRSSLDRVVVVADDGLGRHHLRHLRPEGAPQLLLEVLVAELERAAEERHHGREVQLALLHDEIAVRQQSDDCSLDVDDGAASMLRSSNVRMACSTPSSGPNVSAITSSGARPHRCRNSLHRRDSRCDPLRPPSRRAPWADACATSPATRPRRGPRVLAIPCSHAPAAAARKGWTPCARREPITPERTSPVPAVARRASPVVDTRTRPSPSATTVVDPLSSTVASVAAARSRAAVIRSGPGGVPGESFVLAVVRRQDGQWVRVAGHVRAERRESVTVDDGRDRRFLHDARTAAIVTGSVPSPGPTTSALNRLEAVEHRAVPRRISAPRCARPRWARRLASDELRPATAEPDVAGARPLRATRGQRRRAGHAWRPGDDPHRGPPLVRLERTQREPLRDIGRLDEMGVARDSRRARCRRHGPGRRARVPARGRVRA